MNPHQNGWLRVVGIARTGAPHRTRSGWRADVILALENGSTVPYGITTRGTKADLATLIKEHRNDAIMRRFFIKPE